MPDLISKGIAGFELANDHFGVLGRFFQTAVPSIVFNLICLIALEILTRALNVPEVLLPRPSRVWVVLLENADILTYQTSVTMFQVIAALILSILFGSALAALFTLSPPVNDMFFRFRSPADHPKDCTRAIFCHLAWDWNRFAFGHRSFLELLSCVDRNPQRPRRKQRGCGAPDAAPSARARQTLLHVRIPMAYRKFSSGRRLLQPSRSSAWF